MTSKFQPIATPLRTGRLYRHPPLKGIGRAKAAALYWTAYQTCFRKQAHLTAWLDALTLPASGRWVYGRIPKTGTNTVLAGLHLLEFGHPISTNVTDPNNTSPDTATRHLDEAGIFMAPLQTTHPPETIDKAFRFTVLRHPVARALLSFAYLGQSHTFATRQLAPVRLRLSAQTGFDWARDPGTEKGFAMFLDFVEDSLSISRLRLDRHIAPQTATMEREILNPHLTGRTEELPAFFAALARGFGTGLPEELTTERRNAAVTPPFTPGAHLRTRVESVFHRDMEWYESL